MSAMSEQDQPTPNDPLYYAPRRLREKLEPQINPANSLYQSLPRALDPEIMHEAAALTRDLDRRKALFGAVAIGVSALAALFVVLMVHASQEPNAGASFAAAVQSMKTVQPQQSDSGSKPALSEFRGLLASTDANQGATRAPSGKLLQQFMQWQQKAGTAETSQ